MVEQGQGLTPTEIVVADLAGRGRRADEIAHELEIDEAKVAEHLSRVYRKLGVEELANPGIPPGDPVRASAVMPLRSKSALDEEGT